MVYNVTMDGYSYSGALELASRYLSYSSNEAQVNMTVPLGSIEIHPLIDHLVRINVNLISQNKSSIRVCRVSRTSEELLEAHWYALLTACLSALDYSRLAYGLLAYVLSVE